MVLFSSDPVTGTGKDVAYYGIHASANDIAAAGGEPVAVLLTLLLPPSCEEKELKAIMAQAEETCASLHIQIAGGHTEVTDAVNRIVLTVTAIGKAARAHRWQSVRQSRTGILWLPNGSPWREPPLRRRRGKSSCAGVFLLI